MEKAKAAYTELIAASPADAPWVDAVKQELASLGAPCRSRAGARPDRTRGDCRHGGRPRQPPGGQGGTADEWARLMRSYAVLGQRDKAMAAARRARQALAQDAAGLKTIDTMAQELKLTDAQP